MPFKSKAQQRACYAKKDPNWDCDEFAEESPPYDSLPEYTPNRLAEIDLRGLSSREVLRKLGVDPDLRPSSMEYLRSGGRPRKTAPVRIYWYPEEGRHILIDGRHRISFAMEKGATEIPFEYAEMGEDGYLHEEGPGVLLVGEDFVENPEPINKRLYEQVKKEIYAKHPEHSAYRSGLLVQEYKRRGGKYRGDRSKGKLGRWFKEDWRNQRGGVGYDKAGDVYRPTKRVSKDTPTTFDELTDAQVRRAQKEKKRTGRVKDFTPNDQDDLSYFYHITYYNRLPGIAARGLITGGAPSIGGAGLDSHRRDAIFLTEFDGIGFWVDRAEQWAHHNSDDLLEEGFVVVVLRVLDTDDLIEECEEDVIGTEDSGHYAIKCRTTIEPEEIQLYWDGEWLYVDDYETIDPAEAFDEEGWLVQDGPNVFTD
jgi:hypothetical protein